MRVEAPRPTAIITMPTEEGTQEGTQEDHGYGYGRY